MIECPACLARFELVQIPATDSVCGLPDERGNRHPFAKPCIAEPVQATTCSRCVEMHRRAQQAESEAAAAPRRFEGAIRQAGRRTCNYKRLVILLRQRNRQLRDQLAQRPETPVPLHVSVHHEMFATMSCVLEEAREVIRDGHCIGLANAVDSYDRVLAALEKSEEGR